MHNAYCDDLTYATFSLLFWVRLDRTLQDLIYKLVPGLLSRECNFLLWNSKSKFCLILLRRWLQLRFDSHSTTTIRRPTLRPVCGLLHRGLN